MNLQNFLDAFGLVASLPALESGELTVKDLLTSSVKKLVESGIPEVSFLLLRNIVLHHFVIVSFFILCFLKSFSNTTLILIVQDYAVKVKKAVFCLLGSPFALA